MVTNVVDDVDRVGVLALVHFRGVPYHQFLELFRVDNLGKQAKKSSHEWSKRKSYVSTNAKVPPGCLNFDRRDPKMELFLKSTEANPCGHLLK